MGLTLYHYANSVCSEKARLALDEKGLKWESCEVDLFSGEQFSAEYLKLNPSDGYTLADLSLTPYVARMEYIHYLNAFTAERPKTRAWWTRVKKRPSFASANAAWITDADIKEMAEGGERTRAAIVATRDEFVRSATGAAT